MRHAILGAGGVGGFLGAALARAGHEVVLLLRPESLERYGGRLRVESALLGDFDVDVPAAPTLDRPVDVLWVTPKATQLEAALELVPNTDAVVVPLLNGIDHVALLRERFERVLPGAIYVESERVDVGRIAQKSSFVDVALAPHERASAICYELGETGVPCTVGSSEEDVLWRKLSVLAPVALTTTARGASLAGVVSDPEWRARLEACAREVAAVAAAEGVEIDTDRVLAMFQRMDIRSSMQKDREARLPLELDAIGGAVLRASRRHGLPTPATQELVELIGD